MIILMIPVARLLFGRSYGRDPCIISIAASCIPMYACIVESSLKEIAKGKIDAAKSVGTKMIQTRNGVFALKNGMKRIACLFMPRMSLTTR